MKLWVTGEAGYIARMLDDSLERHGKHEVVNSLKETYFDYWRKPPLRGRVGEVNIFDPTLKKLIMDSDAEVIVHAAAITDRSLCEANHSAAFQVNVEGSMVVADIAASLRLPVIHLSDLEVYGKDSSPADGGPERPCTVFGFTKSAADQYIRIATRDVLTVFPGWVYGPGDVNGPLSKLFLPSLEEPPKIGVDSETCKPYLYIEDFVTGFEVLLDVLPSLIGQRINITPKSFTFEQALDYLTETLGMNPDFELCPEADATGDQRPIAPTMTGQGWKPKSFEECLDLMKKSHDHKRAN